MQNLSFLRSSKLVRTLLAAGALAALVIGILVLGSSKHDESILNNILVVVLINVNILALLVLVFMVGRNVVKLVFERKRGILGSKLRSRLVVAFVLIACIPMSISFVVASGLINEAMGGWFSPEIDTTVSGAITIARQHVTSSKIGVKSAALRIVRSLDAAGALQRSPSGFAATLEELRNENDLYSLRAVSSEGQILAEASHPTSAVDSFREPPLTQSAIRKAINGESVLQVEERGASQFIRYYVPLSGSILVLSHRMDPDIVQAQREVQDSFREYEELKLFRHPLQSNFILTLTLFNLVSLFGAIWVAFFVAKQITGPIQRLAEGTQSVARGDYDFKVDPTRDDEMGFLVTSFNSMLRDLRSSRDEAEKSNVLIETILANLAVGVIGLDPKQRVTSVNSAAGALLQIDHIHFTPHTPLIEILRKQDLDTVAPLLASLHSDESKEVPDVVDREMQIECGGRLLQVVCTAGKIISHAGELQGYVLLFDDITEITRAQHLAAWRDVARRIAHEIKNPLTPIQLSAQRLEKLLGNDPTQSAVVHECTRTIVEHVALIKRLANEFSEYGRMPTAQFSPTDLGVLLASTVGAFKDSEPDVEMECEILGKIPEMLLDPEQVRGAIINILKNSVEAVRSTTGRKRVSVQASFDRSKKRAFIEITDNGPGISAADKVRVFEPYYTTKKGGTGLGLAIVSTVISDHQGELRLFDSESGGVKVVITLPQFPQPSTLRKLAPVEEEVKV